MLAAATRLSALRALSPALATAGMHTTSLQRAAAAATSDSATLQGVLGLNEGQVQTLLALKPDIAREKLSVLMERVQFLSSGLGISQDRLRSLIVERPALLSDLNLRELRALAGLS